MQYYGATLKTMQYYSATLKNDAILQRHTKNDAILLVRGAVTKIQNIALLGGARNNRCKIDATL
jgi:hypothetical protein